jgi:hypothetical protein
MPLHGVVTAVGGLGGLSDWQAILARAVGTGTVFASGKTVPVPRVLSLE